MASTLLQIEFDPTSTIGYGRWKCRVCGLSYYGGGPACCPHGYENATYLYCPKEKATMEQGRSPGLGPIGLLEAFKEATKQ